MNELVEKVAELFYGGYCEPIDRLTCEWQDALELAKQAIPLISAEARKQVARDINMFDDELDYSPAGNKEFRKMVTGKWLRDLKESKEAE